MMSDDDLGSTPTNAKDKKEAMSMVQEYRRKFKQLQQASKILTGDGEGDHGGTLTDASRRSWRCRYRRDAGLDFGDDDPSDESLRNGAASQVGKVVTCLFFFQEICADKFNT
jgi:hypothetical protein